MDEERKGVRVIVYNGGNWNNGANAGLFNLNLNNDASNANTNIGSRLASNTAGRRFSLREAVQRILFGAIILLCRFVRRGKDKQGGAASKQ